MYYLVEQGAEVSNGTGGMNNMSGMGNLGNMLAGGEEGAQEALQRKLLESSPDTLQQQESLSISGQSARRLVMQRLLRRRASAVLLLRDMVAPGDVDDALHLETQEECSKWGKVERLVIYNERQSEDDDPAHANVKIFVQFSEPEEAQAAAQALNGRYFGGRTVRATIYDQELFDHGDLSG
ncbi:hypothetical protein ACJJTC_017269 [Scirpophaga incertulas]